MTFLQCVGMTMEALEIVQDCNRDFYPDSRAYLDALQKQGKRDDSFEDEFYFTMPGISGSA